jgi:hypothetical protein
MSTNLLGELAANNGTYFLNDGTYTGNIDQIIVRGNNVTVEGIYVFREGQHVRIDDQYVSSSKLANGLRITPKGDEVFSRVIVSSGGSDYQGLELVLA